MRKKDAPVSVPVFPKEAAEIAARTEMLITGVLGIDGYSGTELCVRTGCGVLRIRGEALTLAWAGERRLMLRGRLSSLFFE